MEALANKYRPFTLDQMVGQNSVKRILNRQIELREFKNSYIFYGCSGTGKTTSARAFASAINNNLGNPIEIDAASNNGVDNVRTIVQEASERALDCEYKVIIIDEAHMLTVQAWNAFLKCIEEPPKYTIFIFCTTEKNKIPDTIKNRCMVLNFNKLSYEDIYNRLQYICRLENLTNYQESCQYISRNCNGQMRDALASLDKVISYSGKNLDIDNTIVALDGFKNSIFFDLINYIIDGNQNEIINQVQKCYDNGYDMDLFTDKFTEFILNVLKFILFDSDIKLTTFSYNDLDNLLRCTALEDSQKYYNYYLDQLLELRNQIKNDSNKLLTIQIFLIKMSRLV